MQIVADGNLYGLTSDKVIKIKQWFVLRLSCISSQLRSSEAIAARSLAAQSLLLRGSLGCTWRHGVAL
jgi:hypothetical protein